MPSKKFITPSLAVLSFLSGSQVEAKVTEDHAKNEMACEGGARPLRVRVKHLEPNGIGYREGYTTAEGFFPLYDGWDKWVLFLDARAHVFNSGRPALNTGLGTRYITHSRVFGLNAYYDYRKTHRYHYNQVGGGFESLGKIWDFRVNGYAPIGNRTSRLFDLKFAHFQGNNAIVSQKYEYVLGGFDAEAAAHVDKWKHFPLYFAAGPYYLTGRGASAWGGRARASLSIYDYLKVEGTVSYDHLFRWIGQGQISLTFSLGKRKQVKAKRGNCSSSLALSRRAYQPVDRFEIIPVDRSRKHSKAINPATRQPYFFSFVDNTSSSLGTYESPYATLAAAEANSGPHEVIYVFPGDGTSSGMDTGITLQDYQWLWGSVVAQNLTTTIGNVTIPAQSAGGIVQGVVVAPVITNSTNETVVTIANGNEVSGFYIQNVGGASMAIANLVPVTDLAVLNCAIGSTDSTPYLGIGVTDLAGTLTVNNCTINEGYGVFIYNTRANLVTNISNSNFNNGETASVYWLYNGPLQGTLGIENCTINSIGDGINIQQVLGSAMTATINNTQINAASQGVFMLGAVSSSQTLSMANTTILSENQSVYITQMGTVSATLDNNTLMSTNSSQNTFELDSNAGSTNGTLVFTNNTITSQSGTSVYFNQSAGKIAAFLQNNTILDCNGGTGLRVDMTANASNFMLSFNGNTMNGGQYGLYLNQHTGVLLADCNGNTIDSPSNGYGIYGYAGGTSQTLIFNDGSVNASNYGIDIEQTKGTIDVTLNNNTLVTGGGNPTVFFDLTSGSTSQMNLDGNTIAGYFSLLLNQVGTSSSDLSFTNNTCTTSFNVLYLSLNAGANSSTVSGNTLVGASTITVQQFGGDWDYGMTNNTINSVQNPGYFYILYSGSSSQTISGNNINSVASSAIYLNQSGASSYNIAITENTLTSPNYAFLLASSSGTEKLDLSNNLVTNGSGFNLNMSGGSATWQVNGNQLTAVSGIPVSAIVSGGTISCMQLNDNAIYPTSNTSAYVLNGTGATSFTLNPPTGNTGNTNISTTHVTQTPCTP